MAKILGLLVILIVCVCCIFGIGMMAGIFAIMHASDEQTRNEKYD